MRGDFAFSHSLQLLFASWGLFALIVTAAYSGNLNAYLVTIDYERAIDSGQDILDLKRNFFLPESNALYNIIATSPYQVYQDLLQVEFSFPLFCNIKLEEGASFSLSIISYVILHSHE